MIDVKIKTEGLSDKENQKIELARLKIFRAINSREFKDFVLNFTWVKRTTSGRLWYKVTHNEVINRFASTDLSNEEVYKRVMSGRDLYEDKDDRVINVDFRIDKRNKRSVLGYTYSYTRTMWQYINFFKSASIDDIAGNIAHESIGHNMGFTHDYNRTYRRPYSFPYQVGFFVRNFK